MLPWLLLITTATAPQTPKPAVELTQLRYFEGQWKCDSKITAHDGEPERTVKAKLVAKMDLERYWLTVQSAEVKEKNQRTAPHTTSAFWGYDKEGQQFTRMGVGSHGEAATATSTGWSGDEFVWSGTVTNADGQRVPFRHTITRVDPLKYSEKIEINVGGQWLDVSHGTCQK